MVIFKSFVIYRHFSFFFSPLWFICKSLIHEKDSIRYSWVLTWLPNYKVLKPEWIFHNWSRFYQTADPVQILESSKSNLLVKDVVDIKIEHYLTRYQIDIYFHSSFPFIILLLILMLWRYLLILFLFCFVLFCSGLPHVSGQCKGIISKSPDNGWICHDAVNHAVLPIINISLMSNASVIIE